MFWKGLILPDQLPYNIGAYKIEINFPGIDSLKRRKKTFCLSLINIYATVFRVEYPYKPPKLVFITKVYHPNIDEKGQIKLPILRVENWKQTTKIEDIIQAIIDLFNEPDTDRPLRVDLAEGKA